MYRYIFFDLDGTLTDSSEGILNCLRYAMQKMGAPAIPPETEKLFIGPPLLESFSLRCGFDEEQAKQAIVYFRERYVVEGKKEVSGIPGMPGILQKLKDAGKTLAITSSKEHIACCEVVDHLGLTPYFDVISGSPSDYQLNTKEAVIRHVMGKFGLSEADSKEILLVGDRKYDVLGAAAVGIDCLGVTFCGFAPEGELEEAGAIAVVSTPEEMGSYILTH